MKTDNTVAALHIPSNLTVKIITMHNNQCHAEQSFLRSHQLLSYSFNSLSSTQHISSLLFPPQPHSHPPTQFLYPTHILLSHTFFTEQRIYYGPHVQCTSNTMLTHLNEGQKSETLTNQSISYLMNQSQIGINNT